MKPFKLAMAPMVSGTDIDVNAQRICDLAEMAANRGCGMICFPEAALTGYSSSEPLSVKPEDLRVAEIADMSQDITIVFGYFERNDKNLTIKQAVCENGDIVGSYVKTHLGMREEKVFEAGDSLPVIETKVARIGIALCWESRFPEISGTYEHQGAELILMPAASNLEFDRRMASWSTLISTRASDNRAFVAACNNDGRAAICASPDGKLIGGIQDNGFMVYDIDETLYEIYRTGVETMHNIRYAAHRRPDLYR